MLTRRRLTKEDLRERENRAKEWVAFRRSYLFSQRKLAEILGCSRRTVVAVESGVTVTRPHCDLLRRFANLKRKHEQGRATGWAA